MSAFLGPIHVKMYDRILYQDRMTQAILDLAAQDGWNDQLAQEADKVAPAASDKPLEEIIDAGNIHGWLNDAVATCEKRLAYVVCAVTRHQPERMEGILQAMRSLGQKQSLPTTLSAEDAYRRIHDILLDGMPCDFPFQMMDANEGSAEWKVMNCPHAAYWIENECDAQIYYQLRDAWLDGALENSGIAHSRTPDGTHTLRKEV